MSADPSPAFSAPTDFADAGSLHSRGASFALVPDWVIGAELSDAAFRVYSLLLRFGNGSGCRMPSRRLLAERMRRSVDSIDRAMRELEAQRIVRVEHRRRGRENLTNRYHLRTKDPSTPQPRGSNSGRRSAATPIEAGSGTHLRPPLAAAMRRPWPQICGPTETVLPTLLLLPDPPRRRPRRWPTPIDNC